MNIFQSDKEGQTIDYCIDIVIYCCITLATGYGIWGLSAAPALNII